MSNDSEKVPTKCQFLVYQAEDGELAPEATVKKYLTVRQEGRLV
ncbi:hypothetical protein [Marinospirillum insulare]|uniref:Uncharacterized protein n=1 Tax=Marinospirillum insulare TaxID=217169 RepID=A0ABQ5ZU32_9GAMM|nr:hypothetical protein [Marinospirillum insulare]GLR62936.1 hypothetical protein GCM10007878_03710 [Marinospirillum insulare]